MGKEYTNAPITLTTSAPATVAIATESINLNSGVEFSDNGSGSIYAEGMAVTGIAPVATITTKAIESFFTYIGLNGQCIGSGQALTQFVAYYRNLTNCQSGAASHLKDTITTGLLRLASLSCPRGQDAVLSASLDALTDGTNAPIARATGATLPTSILSQRYTLYGLTINSVAYDEADSVDINFDVQITDKTPRLGSIWPHAVGVRMVRPRITIQTRDLSKITNALQQAGAEAAAHADTKIKLVKRSSPGAFVDPTTSSHITITACGLNIPETLASASGTGNGSGTLTLATTYDGTNAPLVITTGAALT